MNPFKAIYQIYRRQKIASNRQKLNGMISTLQKGMEYYRSFNIQEKFSLPILSRSETLLSQMQSLVSRMEQMTLREFHLEMGIIYRETTDLRQTLQKQLGEQKKQLGEQKKQLGEQEDLLASYNLWRKRLSLYMTTQATTSNALIPNEAINKEQQWLLQEQARLIAWGKELGIKPTFDKDGWLTDDFCFARYGFAGTRRVVGGGCGVYGFAKYCC